MIYLPKYTYRGYNEKKEIVIGEIEASSTREAIHLLKKKGIKTVFSMKPKLEIPFIEKWKERVSKIKKRFSNSFKSIGEKVYIQSKDSEIIQLIQKIDKALSTSKKEGLGKPTINIFIDNGTLEDEIIQPARELIEKPRFKQKIIKKNKELKIPWEKIRRPAGQVKRVRISSKEIRHFTRQLAVLLSSGVSLSQALISLQEHIRNRKLKGIIGQIYSEIQEGNSLSYAMSRFPNQFNSLYLALVSVGETSGALDKCLFDITEFLQTQHRIKKSIKDAMIYPAIILTVVSILLIAGSQFFIPMFSKMFADLGLELPTLTKVVFWIADRLKYILIVLIAVIILLNTVFRFIKPLRRNYIVFKDTMFLRLPVIKDFVITMSMFYFAHALSLMLRNGIRIIDSLSMVLNIVPNKIIQAEIKDSTDLLIEGANLSEALMQQPHFSSIICSMVSTGEESGRLDEILDQTADYYSEQLKGHIETLVQWVQPAAILMIAAVVIPVVFAIFIPLLDVTSGQFMK